MIGMFQNQHSKNVKPNCDLIKAPAGNKCHYNRENEGLLLSLAFSSDAHTQPMQSLLLRRIGTKFKDKVLAPSD